MEPIHTTEALGALIRAERRAQGLRQPDLAAVAGTSVRFIVEIERGKPTARIGKVLDVLRQLGLQLHLEGLTAERPSGEEPSRADQVAEPPPSEGDDG